MPPGFPYRPKFQVSDDPVEERVQNLEVPERRRPTPLRVHNPFSPIHNAKTGYCCACPHSGQNLLARGIGLPQFIQNFVSGLATAPPPAVVAPDSPPEDPAFLSASIIACPMATPAPSPAATPATPPPPSLAAAVGMDCATSNCVYRPMSPTMFMLMRWSRIFCSSSGRERFSTTKLSRFRPRSVKVCFSCPAMVFPSVTWLLAISRKGTWLLAKVSVMRPMMVLRN